MFENKFMSPGSSSGGNFGDQSAGGQQDPDYKKMYDDLLKKAEKLIDPTDYDVSKDKRYTGLMQTLQKEQDDKKELKTKFDDLSGQFTTVKSEHATATQSVSTLQAQLDKVEIEKDSLAVQNARVMLIMRDFPQLALFEAEGLLPETGVDDKEDALKTLFTNFSAKLGVFEKKAQESFGAGGLPKPAGAGGEGDKLKASTAQAELNAANEASKANKPAEYKQHYDAYLALLGQQGH
jgi:hypothetical protein